MFPLSENIQGASGTRLAARGGSIATRSRHRHGSPIVSSATYQQDTQEATSSMTGRDVSRRHQSRDLVIWAKPLRTKKPLDASTVRAGESRGPFACPFHFCGRQATTYQERGAFPKYITATVRTGNPLPTRRVSPWPQCSLCPLQPLFECREEAHDHPLQWRAGRRRGATEHLVVARAVAASHDADDPSKPRWPAANECWLLLNRPPATRRSSCRGSRSSRPLTAVRRCSSHRQAPLIGLC